MIWKLLVLWLVFDTKHYLADFVFQNKYMLGKFNPTGWVKPLAAHCLVHATFTLAICLVVNPSLSWLAVVDFVVHFIMDRIKASPKLLGRFKSLCPNEFATATPEQKRHDRYFWLALGFDQYVHHLTNLGIAAALMLL